MTIVIDGTTGISGVDGTASNPSYEGTDSNTGIFFPAADTIAFAEGGAEVARFDSAGNFGLGTSLPAGRLHVAGQTRIQDTANAANYILIGSGANAPRGGNSVMAQTSSMVMGTEGAAPLIFITNAAEGMRLDSSGNLGLGVTPSAWGGYKSIDITSGGSVFGFATNYAGLSSNAYNDGTGWKYKNTAVASLYQLETNTHVWYRAASGTAGNLITFTQAMTLDASGNLAIGKTDAGAFQTVGIQLRADGDIGITRSGAEPLSLNRLASDGTLVNFYRASSAKGSISVSGETVSYNAFAGSHWSQLSDGSKPEILRGTVMESINELCVWADENNERLPKSKVSDTAGSKKVYGVFMDWDNDWTATNDMYVTAVGAFVCRVNGNVTVQEGDLLESNGDGTARVQADDIIRSSTIGKVTCTTKTHEYDDGSYCVPTVLYCG